jgi:hypothetical protein
VATLYMGSSTALAGERQVLVGDLEQLCRETGARIRIEPGVPLPADPVEAQEEIRAALERSTMSLHLVGGAADECPPGWSHSQAVTELAIALSQPLPYRPLVWLPRTVAIGDVDSKSHTKLLEALRDTGRPPDLPSAGTAEFFHADIEELKSTLHRRVVPPTNPIRASLSRRSKRRQLIYVCYKGAATGAALPKLESWFDSAFYEVWAFDHGSANAPARHHATLENCDGFAVVYDPSTLEWADSVAHDALICSRTQDRPRALAAVETPPPGLQLGIRADSLVEIHLSDNGYPRDPVKRFLAALGDSHG